jgi:hypothetical protein
MAFIMMLSEGSMLDWSAVFLVDKAGMIDKNAGIGYTVFSIAMTMSLLGGNPIVQRLGRKWPISAGAHDPPDVSSAVDVSSTSPGATSVMRGESGTMTIRMENQRL